MTEKNLDESIAVEDTPGIVPGFLDRVGKSLDDLNISAEDIQKEREATKKRTKGILGENADYMMDIRDIMLEKFQASLDKIVFPRQLDYRDVEVAIQYIQGYFEGRGHEFKIFSFPNELGDTNEFEADFSRRITRLVLERYLSSFPSVEKKSKKMKKKDLKQLPPKLSNILHNPILEELLMTLSYKGMIKVSDNIGNTFSKEVEQKILEIDKEDVVTRLEKMNGVEKRFEGYVTDTYYDFPDNRLEKAELKSSFRIRKKECAETGKVTYFYTVKRKDKASTHLTGVRDCWEEEFEITKTDVNHIQSILKDFGMHEFKTKSKYRTSYQHKERGVKFDIDDYKGIPTFLEIESEKIDDLTEFKELLGLQNHRVFNSGTTKLMKEYGIDYPKFEQRDESISSEEK